VRPRWAFARQEGFASDAIVIAPYCPAPAYRASWSASPGNGGRFFMLLAVRLPVDCGSLTPESQAVWHKKKEKERKN